MFKSTYQTDYQAPAVEYSRPISTHGTLAREGIMPVKSSVERGIEGTRFLSRDDIKVTAQLRASDINPFPGKPLSPKEERMVQGTGYRLGLFGQRGGFLGERRAVLKRGKVFEQYEPCDAALKEEFKEIIKQVEYADFWRAGARIARTDNLRIDVQGITDTHANIQVQVNKPREKKGGKMESTSVSSIFIDSNLSNLNDEAHKKHLVSRVIHAFSLSLNTRHRYEINLEVETANPAPGIRFGGKVR